MTTETPALATAPARQVRRRHDMPGPRAFRSAGFRVVVALTVWVAASLVLGLVLGRQASDPAGQYAFDFQTYHQAATDVANGHSPYVAVMFDGPIPAQGAVGASLYKYPPTFAQAIVPLAMLPLDVAAAIWLVLQAAMLFGAVWLALMGGGAARNLESASWSGLAVTLFLPAFDTLWKGNVSGLLALLVALALTAGFRGGAAAAAAALTKLTPVVLLLPVVGRRSEVLSGALWLLLPVAALSVLVSPAAWLDFVRALPNLVAGPARFPSNLALDNLADVLVPSSAVVADAMRGLSIAAGIAAAAGALLVARRESGWPVAVGLAVAALLLLPNATWYHYFAVLLPVAAFAWPRAGIRARLAMVTGAATVTFALLWLPLASLGGGVMLGSALVVLWPRPQVGRAARPDLAAGRA